LNGGKSDKFVGDFEGFPKVLQPSGPVTNIMDCDSTEMARQLSLIEFEIYERIEPKECFGLGIFPFPFSFFSFSFLFYHLFHFYYNSME